MSLKGQMLLAAPSLSDGTFDHSVILLAEHSATSGAFGCIINHPSGNTVGEIVPHLASSPLASLPVHGGGPVSPQELTFSSITFDSKGLLVFSPRISAQAATHSLTLKNHIVHATIVHATIGHSAWSPGQLENELLRNTWFALRPKPDIIAEPLDINLWKKLLSAISPFHALLAQAPKNPLLN